MLHVGESGACGRREGRERYGCSQEGVAESDREDVWDRAGRASSGGAWVGRIGLRR